MIFFCMLWVFLVLLFRRSLGFRSRSSTFVITAVLLGVPVAFLRYFFGFLIPVSDFGLILWLHALVDVVAIPVLIPLSLRALIALVWMKEPLIDYGEFTLLYLVPLSLLHGALYSGRSDPLPLVIMPIIWTSVAIGIPYLIGLFKEEIGFVSVISLISAIILPFTAAFSYLFFFSGSTEWGIILLILSSLPMAIESLHALPSALRPGL